MEEDAKSKSSDIEKLRKILDNPDDKALKDTLSKNKNLDSIRRRLSGETPPEESQPSNHPEQYIQKSTNFEPRVTIHDPEETSTQKKLEPEEEPCVQRRRQHDRCGCSAQVRAAGEHG